MSDHITEIEVKSVEGFQWSNRTQFDVALMINGKKIPCFWWQIIDYMMQTQQKWIARLREGESTYVVGKTEDALNAKLKALQEEEVLAYSDITCMDCNGSGKYHGLTAIEDCKTCNGSGRCEIK